MITKRIFIAALAASAFALAANAESMNRDEAVAQIIENNLRLKALAKEHQADATELKVAGRLNTQPEVEFEHMWGPESNRKWNIGVTQGFDWPGVYKRRAREADARIGAFEYLYKAEQRQVTLEARLTIDNATYVNKQLTLTDHIISNVNKVKEKVSTAYQHGQVTLLDIKKIDFELYSLNAKRAELQQQLDALKSQLSTLNGGDSLNVDLNAYMPQSLLSADEYSSLAVKNNPSVKAAMQNAEAARLASRTAAAERLPGFSLGYRHAYEENTHFNGFSVGISLPVFTNKAASKAADIRAIALSFEASETATAQKARINATYTDAARRGQSLREMSKVVLENNYPDLLLMAYNGGQINVITYLQELSFFESAQSEYLAAEYAYITDLTTLNTLTQE